MEWISVKDRLPEFGVSVLTFDDEGKEIHTGIYCTENDYHLAGWFCTRWHYCLPDTITHWMPLPEAPKE